MEEQNEKPDAPPRSLYGYWIRIKFAYWDFTSLFKKINFRTEKLTINIFVGIAFISIAIGLGIFIKFIHRLSEKYSINSKEILMAETGQTGDFIGGIVGSIWALTGVLLFYAALRMQSRELAENRKHFQLNRLTEIIYKQLEIFNVQVLGFELKDVELDQYGKRMEYKGHAAISLIGKQIRKIVDPEQRQAGTDAYEQYRSNQHIENFAFIETNKQALENIYTVLEEQVTVIRAVLIKEDIPPVDLNELKSLFFRNIGTNFLSASDMLLIALETYIKVQEKMGKKLDPLFSPEITIKHKIEMINNFRKKRLDRNILKTLNQSRESYNDTSI